MGDDHIKIDPVDEIMNSFSKYSFYAKFLVLIPLLFALVVIMTAMQQDARATLTASAAKPVVSESVSLSPSSYSTRVGSTFAVALKINTLKRINAAEVVLNYPSTYLEVSDIQINREAFDVTVTNNFGGGSIHLVAGSTKPLTGNITMATITLRALGRSSTKLQFGSPINVLSFDTNLNIPVTTINGSYRIR